MGKQGLPTSSLCFLLVFKLVLGVLFRMEHFIFEIKNVEAVVFGPVWSCVVVRRRGIFLEYQWKVALHSSGTDIKATLPTLGHRLLPTLTWLGVQV